MWTPMKELTDCHEHLRGQIGRNHSSEEHYAGIVRNGYERENDIKPTATTDAPNSQTGHIQSKVFGLSVAQARSTLWAYWFLACIAHNTPCLVTIHCWKVETWSTRCYNPLYQGSRETDLHERIANGLSILTKSARDCHRALEKIRWKRVSRHKRIMNVYWAILRMSSKTNS